MIICPNINLQEWKDLVKSVGEDKAYGLWNAYEGSVPREYYEVKESTQQTQPTQPVKEGVDFVFEQNPELASIGSPEQYSAYLETIFPDSQVKDIVYHGGKIKNKFERKEQGIFFAKHKRAIFDYLPLDKNGLPDLSQQYSVILNINNLKNAAKENIHEDGVINNFIVSAFKIKNPEYDGIFGLDMFNDTEVYAVFEPEQIHILGSKQDIQGFKGFVGKSDINSTFKNMEVPNTNRREDEIKFGFKRKDGSLVSFFTRAAAITHRDNVLKDLKKNNPAEYERLMAEYSINIAPTVTKIKSSSGYMLPKNAFYVSLSPNRNTLVDSLYGEFNINEANEVKNSIFSEGKNSNEVLNSILNSELLSPEINELAKLLLDINVPVVFISNNSNKIMSTNGEVIFINTNALSESHPLLAVESFVHELVHVKLVSAVETPVSEAEKFLSKRVKYLFGLYKIKDKEGRYGFTDESEFVAELLAKKEFRNYVKSLENGNIWNRFVNFISEFLGIKTGSAKLIKELENFIETSENKPQVFKTKYAVVNNSTRKVLEKIINSTATRIKTLENRSKETSQDAIKPNEELKNVLLKFYKDNKDLEGIIAYLDNLVLFVKDFDRVVKAQRDIIDKKDYDGVLKRAGTIRSLGSFTFSHSIMMDEIIKSLDEISKENPNMSKEIAEIKKIVGSVAVDLKRLKNDYKDLSRVIFAKFLLPFGMDRTLDHIVKILSEPAMDISFKSRWLDNLQESGDEILGMIDVALKNHYNEANLETLELEKSLLELKESLEKAGISNMEFMIKKDSNGKNTNYFVTERNVYNYQRKRKEFYDSLPDDNGDAAIKKDNIDRIRKFKEKNVISKNHNTAEYYKLLEQKSKEYGDNFSLWLELNSVKNPENGNVEIPIEEDTAFNSVKNTQIKYSAYFSIMKTKLNMEKHYPESRKNLRRLPQIRKDFIERIKGGNWNRMFEGIKEGIQIKEDDTDYGNDFGLTDEAGNMIQFLPVYFTRLIKNPEDLSTDIISSMIAYGYSSIKREKLSLIADVLELGKEVIKERGVFVTSSRDKVLKIVKKFTGNRIEEEKFTEGGNVWERLTDYLNMFVYGKQKKEGSDIPYTNINWEKFLDAVGRYSALTRLAGNLYATMANSNTGETLIALEAIQGKFGNKKSWGFAKKTYYANLPGVLGDVGKRLSSGKLSLWSEYMDSMNDFKETIFNVNAERKTKVEQLFKSSSLFFTSRMVEHRLHNEVSLMVADTYRFNPKTGRFEFKDEFYKELTNLQNEKANALKAIKKEELAEIKKLGRKASKEDIKSIHSKYKSKYDSALRIDNKDKVTTLESKLDAEWNSLTNYWDAHEVKNNRLVLKESFSNANSNNDRNKFINRQHGVNSTIQGMYSELDKNALQQQALGRLAMMYRKWIIPAYNRRFGDKFTDFEKQMDVEGYYKTSFHFMMELIKDLKSGSFSLMKNWHSLTNEEKSNVTRTLLDVSLLVALGVVSTALMNLRGDDDDDWALNMVAYNVLRLRTELGSLTPPFTLTEALKIINSPVAAVSTIQGLYYSMNMLNWFDVIEKGKYEGMYVIQRNLIRNLPLAEPLYSLKYPEEKLKYFSSKSW